MTNAPAEDLTSEELDRREAAENAAIEAEHKALRERADARSASAGPMLDGDINF